MVWHQASAEFDAAAVSQKWSRRGRKGPKESQELLHRGVGDAVILAKGHMETRFGTIRRIVPKYVRRFQDCMGEMQVCFGSASTVESVHIGTAEPEISQNLQKILESAKRRGEAIAQLCAVYDEHPISLHLLGDQFGKSAYLALAGMASKDGQKIKCSLGSPEERGQSIFALQTSSVVVVDLTAIATVRMVGLEKIFKTRRFRFQMSEDTWNELQDTLVGDLFVGSSGGTLVHLEGKTTFVEETAEERLKRRDADRAFLDELREAVEVVPVMELAGLELEMREALEKMFGQYGAESILLASRQGAL